MILTTAPQNEAVMSNVGAISDFKIKASAKSFQILSSGLYQNKILAILRELSCNAVDSHVAAGKRDTPFDLHLPSDLEPWFSIRDYGTGLSDKAVCSIYTTYFESTKTDSNDYIGALGLGSKTPFSYTDNFTITAIKDGVKGIYTAFINDSGVPSVVQMSSDTSDEPSGVEIRFAVTNNYDTSKFLNEARYVFTYFKVKPIIVNNSDFRFNEKTYADKDIVPGVHYLSGQSYSIAVMGNIAYPINIPAAETSLGDLALLLGYGVELHFNIGELDFQASREGLSYIPLTVNSIKEKLQALQNQLLKHLTSEADLIPNLWDRAVYLQSKRSERLWRGAVELYVKNTTFPFNNLTASHIDIDVVELAATFNINAAGFRKHHASVTASILAPVKEYGTKLLADGSREVINKNSFTIGDQTYFVITDTKMGAGNRAKYHWRNKRPVKGKCSWNDVYVLSKADKTKPMLTDEFFKFLISPPADQIFLASALLEQPTHKTFTTKDVTILTLVPNSNRNSELVWRDAGKVDALDSKQNYYYLPLKGYELITTVSHGMNPHKLSEVMKTSGIAELSKLQIYGVRKSDIERIKTLPNWINLELHIQAVLSKFDSANCVQMVFTSLADNRAIMYNKDIVNKIKDQQGAYYKVVMQLKNVERHGPASYNFERIFKAFNVPITDFYSKVALLKKEFTNVLDNYPLLRYITNVPHKEIAQYINLIDSNTQKGI